MTIVRATTSDVTMSTTMLSSSINVHDVRVQNIIDASITNSNSGQKLLVSFKSVRFVPTD